MCVFTWRCSPNAAGSVETLDEQTETESVVSFRRERPRHRESMEHGEIGPVSLLTVNLSMSKKQLFQSCMCLFLFFFPVAYLLIFLGSRMNGQSRMERHLAGYESATTVMSSELETTSFCDSDDDDTMSRFEAKGKNKKKTGHFLSVLCFL